MDTDPGRKIKGRKTVPSPITATLTSQEADTQRLKEKLWSLRDLGSNPSLHSRSVIPDEGLHLALASPVKSNQALGTQSKIIHGMPGNDKCSVKERESNAITDRSVLCKSHHFYNCEEV